MVVGWMDGGSAGRWVGGQTDPGEAHNVHFQPNVSGLRT